MKRNETWIYRHPSGHDKEYRILRDRIRGWVVENMENGSVDFWSDAFVTTETERGNLHIKQATPE